MKVHSLGVRYLPNVFMSGIALWTFSAGTDLPGIVSPVRHMGFCYYSMFADGKQKPFYFYVKSLNQTYIYVSLIIN